MGIQEAPESGPDESMQQDYQRRAFCYSNDLFPDLGGTHTRAERFDPPEGTSVDRFAFIKKFPFQGQELRIENVLLEGGLFEDAAFQSGSKRRYMEVLLDWT